MKPFEQVIIAANYIRVRNKTGYRAGLDEMSVFEFEALMLLENEFEIFEDSLKVHQAETFAMVQGFLKGN